ncbi:MAG: DUF2911 domain-containing protein [Sediminibacterium sp.]|jgi:hypothetical protein|uniref:DUF2911 domain-containing protein n=1 Tax=Sediminibacterium sp. TaxID=1917865 RepID=UPI002AB9A5DD|nr:DUF2911 domain-containing protein [Sediminibacterium sp.]MDZ4070791.1 DUF2911 domain-containing protein [Sediminibacterium sp.]
MKKLFAMMALTGLLYTSISACAQDKSKRPSPPAHVSETVGGTKITIDYSQPSLKGRELGKDIEPKDGKVWRAGANEKTWIEFSKDVTIEGKPLAAGKYGFFTLKNGNDWTLIFSKKWEGWGTQYNESDDALRVNVKQAAAGASEEKLTYTISKAGVITLAWGTLRVDFTVK